jgi:hypothetical protein
MMHMQVGYGWLQVEQPVQRSLQNLSLQLERSPSHNHTLIILFVSEHLFCSNDPCILWRLLQGPNLVAGEVV